VPVSRIESLKDKARSNRKKIILPEGEDSRIVEAASIVAREKIADVILLGDKETVEKNAAAKSVKLDGVEVVDPLKHPRFEEFVTKYYERRKAKGISHEDARAHLTENFVTVGALMIRFGLADGFVAGASHPTADVARAALYCLELDRRVGVLSSSFVVELDNCPYGEKGLFIYADCGIIPDPGPNQLAGIAMACGELINVLFDVEPRVALLSYSTKGSAKGRSIDKVKAALDIIKEKDPALAVDGELQGDAAVVPEVAAIKCKDSKVAGRANVLVFPNLDAGNICYKLTQRLGNARVVGPLLMGPRRPASDLSRGCGLEEIIDAVTITAVRAQRNKEM